MKRSDLQFAKAWSELPASNPVELPWDVGCWKHVIGRKSLVDSFSKRPMTFERPLPPHVFHASFKPETHEPAKKPRPQGVAVTSWQQIVKSSSDESWTEMRDAQFQTALRRWLDVILQLPESCSVVVQLKQLTDVSSRLRMMRDLFVKKAPQTLLKRCHSFLRFVQYLKDAGEIFPGTESGLYGFLCDLRTSGAPTSNIQSIMQSLNFAQHVIGLPELIPLTMSKRCLGSAGKRNEGPRKQASPFRLDEMRTLHEVLHDVSEDTWTRVFVGTVLMAIYSRSRWSDLQHAESLDLDINFFGEISYVELKITNHKCQESTAFRNIFLCAVAPGVGVCEQPWISEWMSVREALGISFKAGHPTLPAPDSDGRPTRRPLYTDEMKQWINLVLTNRGHSIEGRRLTSHSCKCTMLSWLAKHGDDWTDRMALGGHISFMKSAVVYSRDAMARPLRILEALLLDIRLSRFLPDETRSGRFRDGPMAPVGADLESAVAPSDDGTPFSAGLARSASHVSAPGLDVWQMISDVPASGVTDAEIININSSGDEHIKEEPQASSSESDALTTSSSEDEAGASHTGAARPVKLPSIPESLKLIQHVKYKTLHLMERQNFRVMLCGRVAVEARYEPATSARFETPCCHTCWKRKAEYEG